MWNSVYHKVYDGSISLKFQNILAMLVLYYFPIFIDGWSTFIECPLLFDAFDAVKAILGCEGSVDDSASILMLKSPCFSIL